MDFGKRIQEALDLRNMSQADLCRNTGLKSGHISQYMTNPDRDPRLSTALKIANALDVSLDWLAGRSDDREIKYRTERARVLVDCFESLNETGKDSIMEQMDFQLERNSKSVPDTEVPEVA